MAYTRDSIPRVHTEFGGGPELIDPELRKDRVLTAEQIRMEMMFTNPAPPDSAALGAGSAGVFEPGTVEAEAALDLRVAQIELENDPQTTPVPRVQIVVEEA